MKKPHIAPSDISMDEIRKAIGDNATKIQVEDFLFDNLNDDFSLDNLSRENIINWYWERLNK